MNRKMEHRLEVSLKESKGVVIGIYSALFVRIEQKTYLQKDKGLDQKTSF